jgi:lipoprotein-releasing system ATP-binding protein
MTEVPAPRREDQVRAVDSQSRSPDAPPILVGRGIYRVYFQDDGSELSILEGVEIAVAAGEAVAIMGASGSGKSTLLHLLGGLDRPTRGEVVLGGQNLSALPDAELAIVRNRRVGFVFQFHHLLREFTALENVMMPLLMGDTPDREASARATDLLAEVGLSQRLSHKPWQLSGGEQQRVAVARALANSPAVVIADEPSGNLDTHTAEQLHELFFRLRTEHGIALVLATHNKELADRADRILQLKEGQLRSFYPA